MIPISTYFNQFEISCSFTGTIWHFFCRLILNTWTAAKNFARDHKCFFKYFFIILTIFGPKLSLSTSSPDSIRMGVLRTKNIPYFDLVEGGACEKIRPTDQILFWSTITVNQVSFAGILAQPWRCIWQLTNRHSPPVGYSIYAALLTLVRHIGVLVFFLWRAVNGIVGLRLWRIEGLTGIVGSRVWNIWLAL